MGKTTGSAGSAGHHIEFDDIAMRHRAMNDELMNICIGIGVASFFYLFTYSLFQTNTRKRRIQEGALACFFILLFLVFIKE